MKRNILKVLALTCAVVLLCGMLSIVSFAGSVYSGSTGKIDMERNKLGTDVSCMTFNVLHYNGSSVQNYGGGKYSNRLNYAVNLIKTYTPDILGMQEAGDDYRYGIDWPTDLKSKLTDYSSIVLTDQTSQRDQMYITSALIIWYRSSAVLSCQLVVSCIYMYLLCLMESVYTDDPGTSNLTRYMRQAACRDRRRCPLL